MIQANELRIGNIVTAIRTDAAIAYAAVAIIDSFNGKVTVNESKLKFDTDNNEVRGIPISPEILEKCGLSQSDDFSDWSNEDASFSLAVTRVDEFTWSWNYYHIGKPIKFLHQLQNLYYALTQTELNISL